jgi:hypothetical protein
MENQTEVIESPFLGGDGGEIPLRGFSPPIPPPSMAGGLGSMEDPEGAMPDMPKIDVRCNHDEAVAILTALMTRARLKRAAWMKDNPHLIPNPEDQERTEEPGEKPGELYLINSSGHRWALLYKDKVTQTDVVRLLNWKGGSLTVEEKTRAKKAQGRRRKAENANSFVGDKCN